MSIKIRYFASLKESLGRSEDTLLADGLASVREVWQQANPELVLPDRILVAINQDYASLNDQVNDGDEVAFFPPVTGG
ncbi:MAG: molybdopterin converting factor subunit 1 [Methylovulum sp.]|uniref:molybdopterin converting factor subunit 1 n=1 Tax=Methylovulum sp. TaxID=1916980 RepID=UPI0026145BC6|nr:molybdopterin converting factor subunit 1 [Methylovulum sp.]MDD2724742.1 molybdopterin converting factor subunit 1 [Methylovulum sp.]MDD5124753.1 molybdopterin converting factor subunit 1 [Methylovulum sp.]